jgi:hypothetical protein
MNRQIIVWLEEVVVVACSYGLKVEMCQPHIRRIEKKSSKQLSLVFCNLPSHFRSVSG